MRKEKREQEERANQVHEITQTNTIPNRDGLPGLDSLQPGRRMVWRIGTRSKQGSLICIWGLRKVRTRIPHVQQCLSLSIFRHFGFRPLENRGKGKGKGW